MRRFIVPAFVSVLLFSSGASAQYYQDSSAVVVRNWYRQFLHREAEPSGLTGWSDMLRQGAQPAQVLADILGGDEYSQIAGGTSEGFVRTLFRVRRHHVGDAHPRRFRHARVRPERARHPAELHAGQRRPQPPDAGERKRRAAGRLHAVHCQQRSSTVCGEMDPTYSVRLAKLLALTV